jgi:hypothetical protein
VEADPVADGSGAGHLFWMLQGLEGDAQVGGWSRST